MAIAMECGAKEVFKECTTYSKDITEDRSKNENNSSNEVLTDEQKAQIERNRQKALLRKQARMMAHPYQKSQESSQTALGGSVIRVQGTKLIDTGGGFLLEENDFEDQLNEEFKISSTPAPIIKPDRPVCEDCSKELADSFLFRSFDCPVCDECRDNEEKHCLITKTDARNEFLLKDCDFERREPPLKFIVRKNPHNPRWGDMKLYLRLQVEKRAMEVWGSEKELEEYREQREEKKEKTKLKKYNKQVKALRMAVRSSLYNKTTETHQHEYGSESYNEDDDTYSHSCTSCGYTESYEKM